MFECDLDLTKNNTNFSCSEFMNREKHEYFVITTDGRGLFQDFKSTLL